MGGTMLLKSKICITSLVIYEIIAVSILHFQRICDAIFTSAFCDSWYRYFLFCVALPLVALLIWMWISEIIHVHRRHKFIKRAKNAVHGIISGIRGRVSENITPADMEKIRAGLKGGMFSYDEAVRILTGYKQGEKP